MEEETPLITVRFKASGSAKKIVVEKNHFPMTAKVADQVNQKKIPIVFLDQNTAERNVKAVCAKDHISRPRNQFIIARIILSKLIEASNPSNAEGISKVISIVSIL